MTAQIQVTSDYASAVVTVQETPDMEGYQLTCSDGGFACVHLDPGGRWLSMEPAMDAAVWHISWHERWEKA
jgi:hypothetical protein